ncbi:Scr1 family TA system antitoxin-like transcriptional regulator [Kitasatospora sp. NPDC006697]|uniref:helix-turn-helix domain-containing protein n=1 Tax=Kitasatospora sp. NPDC006697 TaxID=3364020 RepID=UPI0036746EA9
MNLKTLNPTVSAAAAFGDQLRKSRIEMGLPQEQLGALLGCTGSHISGLETAVKSPGREFAEKLDRLFGTGLMFQILRRAISEGVFMDGFAALCAEESNARQIRQFDVGVIPGLFQTLRYAQTLAMTHVQAGTITEAQARERVSFLEARQRRLIHNSSSPMHYAVLEESCLRRVVGGAEVMLEQLDHLEKLSARPRITLQAVTFAMGDLRPFNGPIVLVTMKDRSLVGYAESAARGYLERDSDLLASWELAYDQLQAGALSPAQMLDLIKAIRKDLQ